MKHHVNAIIEDDFWQVVKEEKLQEGDFEVESLMSFSGSHWCRSIPDTEHRSTYTNSNRSTGVAEHRSTTPMESTTSCNVVKILTHEEFATKHPHPPNSDNVRIDRHANINVDRHSEANIDRQLPFVSTDANKSTSIDIALPASTDINILTSIDIYSDSTKDTEVDQPVNYPLLLRLFRWNQR
ncbi:hypothetical protein F2Q70_00043411 [Brassica cretica]|uniref:Uncharacterized protein n=1 Tax=Brassica cretica TaxID=69181 RepID=A0A8S9KDB3_BRACR|nr:hypothetical protein F2Q70_00043411 [Brassica cretica]